MNPRDPNVQLVEVVTERLGSLAARVVLVGGCTTGLLITDLARPPARATVDVDLIAETISLIAYYELQRELKALGFKEDTELTCRWRLGELRIDVVPTDERILGFTNRWYGRTMQQAQQHRLPSGKQIRVISPPLFIATKLDAFHSRGNGDYGASHDIEDIIAVVDGRSELVEEIANADQDVRSYIQEELDDLLGELAFTSTLGYHLAGDAANQRRIPLIIERLRSIAGI